MNDYFRSYQLPNTVRVWDIENDERPDEPNAGPSRDPEYVACRWVEGRWAAMDYPKEVHVRVEDLDGKVQDFVVTAEPSTVFRACVKEGHPT